MMSLKQLKQLASDNDVVFEKNAPFGKMIDLLTEAGVDLPEDEHEEVKTSDNKLNKFINDYGVAIAEHAALIKPRKNKQKPDQSLVQMSEAKLRSMEKVKRELTDGLRKNQDNESLKRLWTWERSRKIINTANEFALNAMEEEELEEECQCVVRLHAAYRAEVGVFYKYKKEYSENHNGSEEGHDVYTFYVPEVKTPEDQVTKELSRKLSQGFHPEASDYLPEKTIVHRWQLVDTEFNKYFKVV